MTTPGSGRTAADGAPLLGEPVAIEFANTHFAVRGRVREGIGSPALLVRWLGDVLAPRVDLHALEVAVNEEWVGRFAVLRDAIRAACEAAVDGRSAGEDDLRRLNAAAAAAPRWPALRLTESGLATDELTDAGAADAALAHIARDAVALLGGPLRERIRACHGPGCVLLFLKDHPRREWCSGGCGNRARVARHYRRRAAFGAGEIDARRPLAAPE